MALIYSGNNDRVKRLLKQIVRMYADGVSTNKIGAQLGIHKSHVSAVLKQNGIPLRYRVHSPEVRKRMVRLYQEGYNGREVGDRFHTTGQAVYTALRKAGIARRPSHNGFVGDCDHTFFAKIDSEAKAYWLGFLTGDGCVSRSNEIILRLKPDDRAHVEAFRTALQIGNRVRITKKQKKTLRKRHFESNCASASVNSPDLAADLARYGVVPAKTGIERPLVLGKELPRRYESSYWRGLIDADGWVSKWNPNRRRSQMLVGLTGNRALVEAFREFVRRKTKNGACVQPNNNIYKFTVTDSYALQLAHALYDGATVYLDRKMNNYREWRSLRPDWLR